MKFGMMTQFDTLDVQPLKIRSFKIQHGGGRHLKKSKNRHISATARAISTKFGTVTQFYILDRSDC